MHFLLVNDDGWHAPGIQALAHEALRSGHRVTVSAPDRERSGTSHSSTFQDGLHAHELAGLPWKCWRVDGTPADCARLGIFLLGEDRPDMVLAGINQGENIGGASVYSGTIGAAMEASMAGVPAIASSLVVTKPEFDFAPAAQLTIRFALWAMAHPLPRGAIYNLNVPELPTEQIRGIRKATLSPLYLSEAVYDRFVTQWGRSCYYLGAGENVPIEDPNCDMLLLKQGYATVTPLTWNCVLPEGMDEVRVCF